MNNKNFKLNSVTLERFRIFDNKAEFKTSDKDLVLLFGENNAGKSSLAKALMLIENITTARDFSALNFVHENHNLTEASLGENKTNISIGFKKLNEKKLNENPIFVQKFVIQKNKKSYKLSQFKLQSPLRNETDNMFDYLELKATDEGKYQLCLKKKFRNLIPQEGFRFEDEKLRELKKDLESYVKEAINEKSNKEELKKLKQWYLREINEARKQKDKELLEQVKQEKLNKLFTKYGELTKHLKTNYRASYDEILKTNWKKVYEIQDLEEYKTGYRLEEYSLIDNIIEVYLGESKSERDNLDNFKRQFSKETLEAFQEACFEINQLSGADVDETPANRLANEHFPDLALEELENSLLSIYEQTIYIILEKISNQWVDSFLGREIEVDFKSFRDFKICFSDSFEDYFKKRLEELNNELNFIEEAISGNKFIEQNKYKLADSVKNFISQNKDRLYEILVKQNQLGAKYLDWLNDAVVENLLHPLIDMQTAYFYGPKTGSERIFNLGQPKNLVEKNLLSYLALKDEEKKSCKEIFKQIAEYAESEIVDFELKSETGNFYSLEIIKKPAKVQHNFADLGMGYQHFTSLMLFLAVQLSLGKRIFFIEEPCNHLHPSFHQENMVNLFDEIIKNHEIQAIVETHALFFIAGVLKEKGDNAHYVELYNKNFRVRRTSNKEIKKELDESFFVKVVNILAAEPQKNFEDEKKKEDYPS